MLIAFKSFHDHQDSFKLSIKPAILAIEPIHATRHITEKFDELRLLLWTSQLHTSIDTLYVLLRTVIVAAPDYRAEQDTRRAEQNKRVKQGRIF